MKPLPEIVLEESAGYDYAQGYVLKKLVKKIEQFLL